MPLVTPVKNIDDPRISIYRSLKGSKPKNNGIFIAEGDKVVGALLKTELKLLSVLMTKEWFQRFRREFDKKDKKDTRIYIMERREIEKVVGFNLHQGLMATARAPLKLSLTQACRSWGSPHLLLAFNGIRDAENIGLIVRNCVAFGVDTIIVDKNSSDPYLRRAVRVSMGTIFRMPVVYTDCLYAALKRLKQRFKTRIIAAAPGKGNGILTKTDFSGNICVVFGNEEKGLSEDVLRIATLAVRIPISTELDSLNVSCASAIFLHHIAAGRRTA